MRGQRSLFTNLFPALTEEEKKTDGKGRNPELMAARNQCLCARYYFYVTYHSSLRYEAIIKLLSAEFFISAIRVVEVLAEEASALQRMRTAKPERRWFAAQWPDRHWPEVMKV